MEAVRGESVRVRGERVTRWIFVFVGGWAIQPELPCSQGCLLKANRIEGKRMNLSKCVVAVSHNIFKRRNLKPTVEGISS